MPEAIDVINARRGAVVAPAGCGKTHLIVQALQIEAEKPTLVLTHTTAGVAALKKRLNDHNVPKSHYRLTTIDAWAISIISMYPENAEYAIDVNDTPDYSAIKVAALRLLNTHSLNAILSATYSRVLVDEYQDCSRSQHQLTTCLSQILPTVIFGDPMQAIFGFGGDPLPNWYTEVLSQFPLLGELRTPWRWNNADAPQLGQWILRVRESLLAGNSIDLRSCPSHVNWHQISGNDAQDIQSQIRVQNEVSRANPRETLLIIGDSIQVQSRHRYASRARGVSVVERVDYPDVITSAGEMEGRIGNDLLLASIDFLRKVMVNLYGDRIIQRVNSIETGRNRTPPELDELAALELKNGGEYGEAVAFMQALLETPDRRLYRQSAYSVMLEALKRAEQTPETSLSNHVAHIREQHRHAGRSVVNRSLGSTLLLKGLEADHVLILDADIPERNRRMNSNHLYVALSRGAKSISVFSRNPILP